MSDAAELVELIQQWKSMPEDRSDQDARIVEWCVGNAEEIANEIDELRSAGAGDFEGYNKIRMVLSAIREEVTAVSPDWKRVKTLLDKYASPPTVADDT